jgi:uncharacterized protein YbjT (DUF2867 family)
MAQLVTVFGGTGFLGRRIVRHLHDKGFAVRIASRHPTPITGSDPQLQHMAADLREGQSIARAVAGAFGVVNAVSLYVERGEETFHAVHVVAAERLADEARKAGVERLVQISGIGADAKSRSPYIRARGRGEQAVRAAFAAATVMRPAVMFGPDDAFLNTLIKLLRRLPVIQCLSRQNAVAASRRGRRRRGGCEGHAARRQRTTDGRVRRTARVFL